MPNPSGISRRRLLQSAALSAGAGLTASPARAAVVSNYPANKWGTPGLYPGRVVAVTHPAPSLSFRFLTPPIQSMIRGGIAALTGAPDHVAGWKQFFGPGDVVGIKIGPHGNPVSISSPATIMEIANGLLAAGVEQRNIIVFERYRDALDKTAGWFPSWLQTASAGPGYKDDQTGLEGYDADHYVDLPLLMSWQNAANPAHRRSCAVEFITKRVNKIVNLSVLKHHNGAGVTMALKNLSHGLVNNVNRSHDAPGGYQFSAFIPAVVSMPVIRYKAVLHIVDGIHGMYDFGPNNLQKYNWPHKTMYFSTDAVAIDRVGWKAIDAQRAFRRLPPVAESTSFASGKRCEPQYILAAAAAGLGEARDERIDLRTVALS